jgi:AraC-like DNA-binding protein
MKQSYDKINHYLQHLYQDYSVHICIKDFCGFIPINKDLSEELLPFLAHSTPYCLYMKSDQEHYRACLSMIRKIYNKCEREKKSFFGYCHAGVGEYVIPIFDDDLLLGSINAGYFRTDGYECKLRMNRACSCGTPLDVSVADRLYRESITNASVDPEIILPGLEMLAEYLGHSYHVMQQTNDHHVSEHIYRKSSEENIVSSAVEYISRNSGKRISVKELADLCHCSESYLSRIFKKHTEVNINLYINKVRVEQAKSSLIMSDMTISEIAYNVGFNDSNYFSRTFAEIIGIPPTEFRRRFRKNI